MLSVSDEEGAREGGTDDGEKGAEQPAPQATAWPEDVPMPAHPRPRARLKFCDAFQARVPAERDCREGSTAEKAKNEEHPEPEAPP